MDVELRIAQVLSRYEPDLIQLAQLTHHATDAQVQRLWARATSRQRVLLAECLPKHRRPAEAPATKRRKRTAGPADTDAEIQALRAELGQLEKAVKRNTASEHKKAWARVEARAAAGGFKIIREKP